MLYCSINKNDKANLLGKPTVLNYHHLRYFREVAETGHLIGAAKRLHVSQSAVSTQLKLLEENLGQQLFHRVGKKLVLTEAGLIALEYARDIFSLGEELEATIQRTAETTRELRIGALATLSRNFQLAFISPLFAQRNLHLSFRSGSAEDLFSALRQFELDVVLATEPPAENTETCWVAHQIAEQPVSLVAHSRKTNLELSELLRREPLVVPAPGSSIRTGFDALVERLGIKVNITIEVDDMAMLRLIARSHHGLSIVPTIVVKEELASGELEELHVLPGLTEHFYAVSLRRLYPHPVLAELFNIPHEW